MEKPRNYAEVGGIMAVKPGVIHFKLNKPVAIAVVSQMTRKSAYDGAQKTRGRVMKNIHRLGRIDTARMINQLQVRRDDKPNPLLIGYTVATNATDPRTGFPYPIVQEKGSRGHGPKTAPFMVFHSRKTGRVIRTKYVNGVTPGNFFKDALADARVWDFVP